MFDDIYTCKYPFYVRDIPNSKCITSLSYEYKLKPLMVTNLRLIDAKILQQINSSYDSTNNEENYIIGIGYNVETYDFQFGITGKIKRYDIKTGISWKSVEKFEINKCIDFFSDISFEKSAKRELFEEFGCICKPQPVALDKVHIIESYTTLHNPKSKPKPIMMKYYFADANKIQKNTLLKTTNNGRDIRTKIVPKVCIVPIGKKDEIINKMNLADSVDEQYIGYFIAISIFDAINIQNIKDTHFVKFHNVANLFICAKK